MEPRRVLPSQTRVSTASVTPARRAGPPSTVAAGPQSPPHLTGPAAAETWNPMAAWRPACPAARSASCGGVWQNAPCPSASHIYCRRQPSAKRSMERIATSSIHDCEKRMPRRIRQSGNALRKLIRSTASAGVSSGEANGEVLLPRTNPQLAAASQCYQDRLLMVPAPAPPVVAVHLDRWVPRRPRVASFQLRD